MMKPRGFTLIELLIAMSLLGILSVLSWRGIDGMLRAEEQLRQSTAHWQSIGRVIERLQFDLAQPSTHSIRRQGRPDPVMTGIQTPEGDALMFVRRSPDPQQDEQRLGYRLRQGRLELLLWSELDTLAAKDQASALLAPLPPASTIYPLLEGVKTFELRYLDTAKHWQTRWPANDPTALPRAVQLSMQLADGQTIARLFALP